MCRMTCTYLLHDKDVIMAIGARFLMLIIVSTAAMVTIAWLTFYAFNPYSQGRRSCALCRVQGTCALMTATNPEGACCCPQADSNGCFTGAFTCPPAYTCWADKTSTGTCHKTSETPDPLWSINPSCIGDNETKCKSLDTNDCCCSTDGNKSVCNKSNVTDLTCVNNSLASKLLDAVPMGICQLPEPTGGIAKA